MHKRALGAVAVTGVAALALGACGGSSPTTPSNTGAAGTSNAATTTGEPETPSGTAAPVRDTNVDLVIWTDADRSKAVQKYADEFAAENGVTVKVQIATDTRTQFKDATKVGKGPDVIVGAHDWLGELVQNSTVAPINLSADVSGEVPPEGHRGDEVQRPVLRRAVCRREHRPHVQQGPRPDPAQDHGRARRHR